MRITNVTVHCSATKLTQKLDAEAIRTMHRAKGWRDIGYHYVIRLDGSVECGRPLSQQGAGVKGHNKGNVHICLVGGIGDNGKPTDNFHDVQKEALYLLLLKLCADYEIPFTKVCGHRDWFGDTNKDGVIDSRDWLKECPCFDVVSWFTALLIQNGEYNVAG